MNNKLINKRKKWFKILDIIAVFSWSILLFKYAVTGQLYLLIHPNYFLLVFISSFILFLLFIFKTYQVFIYYRKNPNFELLANNQSSNLLPQGWGSSLLIAVAFFGLIINPMVLSSEAALQRGITDTLPPTTIQTQSFLNQIPPEKRSLIEWVRTLNVYPEPDNYTGQKANITGFVVHLDHLPDNYIYLSRFVLTCCAVDAYPVGILVKLPESRQEFPPDTWLEVQGLMNTVTLPNIEVTDAQAMRERRQLVLEAKMVKTIPTPRNPYAY